MIQDLPKEFLDNVATENERALCNCLMTCQMMLDTYSKETDSPQKMLLIRDLMDLNQATVLKTLKLI